ncbi:prolyl oligopeptidase [Lipingzhangella halophila]|uniref:prolyl oligopeptidase n=1 Tax=Lipingzhangella halophila TaxID=1783352 RepID=A0A7W7RHJ9_9ACTN|nr:prolyl oligopeptidase family serine peptidase [Lipingzhangella halophila]MBB4932103.1 prolyl oligopeptidase [Lipingzhangella halophila]
MAFSRQDLARPGDRGAPVSVVDTLHGRTVPDPYRWLEDPGSTATRKWLDERSREFSDAAATWPLRERLATRIRQLVSADLWSLPVRRGPLVFATRRDAGAEHPRLLVLRDGRERVLFDPATDPSGLATLDAWEPSPDGSYVAVQTSRGGTERGELRVLSTASGLPVEEPVPGVRYSNVAWLRDAGEAAFYYVRRDDHDGRRGVWLHRVNARPHRPDALVHACTATRTVPGVRLLGERWLVVSESHGTGHRTDLWIADISDGSPERPSLAAVHVGEDAESEPVLSPDGRLYLRTTLGAPRRRICVADPATPEPADWREVIPEDSGATLDGFTVGGTAGAPELLVTRTRLGVSELTAHDPRDGRTLRRIGLPGEGMVSHLEADSDGSVHLYYADVATQQGVFAYRPGDHQPRPWPETKTAADTDPAAAPDPPAVRRHTTRCRSLDGTRVPVTVFSLASAHDPWDEPAPTILHAYGGFGRPRQFGFSATVLAWLLAGGRYAVAHVRGGGDGGREWHLSGAGRNKIRAVRDLIAAGDSLVAGGYCTRGQLCLSGGSAGGLLVLAAAAQRPDLCAAVIASAPLTDMARFEKLGLGPMWTREFGTVSDPEDFAALLAYSPYHRVLDGHACRYPAVLLTGFHGDTRTDAAHPRKMCAALRGAGAPVLLRYEYDVGHGPRAVTRAIDLAADAHAFAAARTGLYPR